MTAPMKPFLLSLALLIAAPVCSQEQRVSEATVRELLEVSDARNLVQNMYAQLDGMLDQTFKQALHGKVMNPEQEKLSAEMRASVIALMQEQMSWEKLEPVYIKMYADTFTQSDVEGILKFYQTPSGQAMLKKMPLLMQNVMQSMMELTQGLMPRLQPLLEDYTRRIVDAGQ